MKYYFELTKPQLKVFSAICSNFFVVFLVANFATREIIVLIFNVVAAILFWYLAVKAESILEQL